MPMQITFVGRILSVQEQATRVVFRAHDGTGAIEVQIWVNDSDEQVVSGHACMRMAWGCV